MAKDKNPKTPPPTPKGNDSKTNPNLGVVDKNIRGDNPNLPTFRNPPPPPPDKKGS